MLDFEQIKQQYPDRLRRFERAILREYLQYKLLQAIFDSRYTAKLSFLGGTALRIVYGNNRFSEDIDLDNFGLSWPEFEDVIQVAKRFMQLEGFEVEIRNIAKNAYRCYLKFPTLLYQQGLSPFQEEKVLIQLDTTAQGYPYQPDVVLLDYHRVVLRAVGDEFLRRAVFPHASGDLLCRVDGAYESLRGGFRRALEHGRHRRHPRRNGPGKLAAVCGVHRLFGSAQRRIADADGLAVPGPLARRRLGLLVANRTLAGG